MNRPSSLFECFERLTRHAPAEVAVRDAAAGLHWTRQALLHEVRVVTRTLRQDGFRAGDVALVRASGAAFAVAMLAVWARDGVAVAVDAQLTDQELVILERIFGPRCVLEASRGVLRARGARAGARPGRLPPGTAVIKLTSGSTGQPRGIAATADQFRADGDHVIAGMGITPEDVNVAAIPMSHSYGLGNLLAPLVLQGSPFTLIPLPLPDVLTSALSTGEPLVFPGVPYLFDLLTRPDAPGFQRRGLRLCISAGAPLPSRTAFAFYERYGLPIRAFYGTSETGGLCFDSSAAGDAAALAEGCVGTPLPGVELSIRGSQCRVVARGAAIASGYVALDDSAPQGGFREGRFVTDDVARIDASGRLYLIGRLVGRVNISGRKVDPREIELVVRELPGISEAVVAGVADDRRGQALMAYLVAEPGVTRANVLSHLRSKLASWKVPRDVVFLDSLPRNTRGKLDLRALTSASRPSEF